MVERSNSWDSEIQFGNVGYAQRIARNERDAYEEKLVGFLSVVDDPRTRAPEAFEHFGVRVAERDEGVLHVNSDLVTHDAIRHTVLTATRVPSEAILGPAFRNSNDEWYSVMALATELYGTSGVMVATINLERFFDAVSGNALPPGMAVRVIERENESGEETRYKVIIDKQHANDNAVATEVIRITLGQARWNLHWDIMSNYLGGPDRTTETLVWRGGLMLTMMISCILGYLLLQNARFHRQVRDRTAELARNAVIIQLTMDSIDQGFVVWNSDYRLAIWSKACADFWYMTEDMVRSGMHMRELLTHLAKKGVFGAGEPEVLAEQQFQRVIAAGEESFETFNMLDGRTIDVHRYPLTRRGYVAIYTDVTAQTLAERKVMEFNQSLENMVMERTVELQQTMDDLVIANRTKTEFLANMSHELRTPLNAIIGFSDMIRTTIFGPTHWQYVDYAQDIKSSGEHLLKIITDILDVTGMEAGEVSINDEELDVTNVIAECLPMVAGRAKVKNVDLQYTVDDNVPRLRADPVRIKQVLLNLVDNAIKFSRPDNTVLVHVKLDASAAIHISVRDAGVGIATENIPKALERFGQIRESPTQTHEGAGLGLAIVEAIMDGHNGSLQIKSEVGVGTTVTVIFPPERTVSSGTS